MTTVTISSGATIHAEGIDRFAVACAYDGARICVLAVWKTDDEPQPVVGGDVKFPLHPYLAAPDGWTLPDWPGGDGGPLVCREHYACMRSFGFAAKHCLCPVCINTASMNHYLPTEHY